MPTIRKPHGKARVPPPRIFKIVDVASGDVVVEGADARAAIDVLAAVGSIFDVFIYVWHPPAQAWRRLTVGEQRDLWDFRGR